MDSSKVTLVVCLALFIIIGVNAALYVSLSRDKRSTGQIEMLRKAARRARNPWETEDKALEELSRRVAELKKSASLPEDEQEEESS
jgi:hypothetical protein